jgi:hypothetical protein
MKAVSYGAGLLPDREQAFLFFRWRMNTGSLLKIESIGQE